MNCGDVTPNWLMMIEGIPTIHIGYTKLDASLWAISVVGAFVTFGQAHAQTGACCLGDATCVTSDVAGCAALVGEFIGESTDCANVVCDGACCLDDGSKGCLVTSSDGCEGLGEYQGAQTSCDDSCPALIGTAISYQGQLKENGVPLNGIIDLEFSLHPALVTVDKVGAAVRIDAVPVATGLFAVEVDFEQDAFRGSNLWLEVRVRSPHDPTDTEPFVTLDPRQPIMPAPFALALPAIRTEQVLDGPNVIGGFHENAVLPGVKGATISGGGGFENGVPDFRANRATDNFSVVGGGYDNQAGDGDTETIGGEFATVSGGSANVASGRMAVVGGGFDNQSISASSTVGGGESNVADGNGATVGGGSRNSTAQSLSTVGGGSDNEASGVGSTIGGGRSNRATQADATIAGGRANDATGNSSTVGGGLSNDAEGFSSTVAGGQHNNAVGHDSAVGGGARNTTNGLSAVIGGGSDNSASGDFAVIPGGFENFASGDYAFAAGHRASAGQEGAFVWADRSDPDAVFSASRPNSFVVRATGGFGINTNSPAATLDVAGDIHAEMSIRASHFQSHGASNFVAGHASNGVGDNAGAATIGGGGNSSGPNIVLDDYCTVSGGRANRAGSEDGQSTTFTDATVAGGRENAAVGEGAAIGGGIANIAAGKASVVPGGSENLATGDVSFAAGSKAEAIHRGAFVWADSLANRFSSTADNQFLIQATGGVGIGTNAPKARLHVTRFDQGLQSSALRSDALVIESQDAVLGIYSDANQTFGSALVLGEVDETGALADKWSLVRRTSGDPRLHLTYGPDANYATNPTMVQFNPTGEVGVGTTAPLAQLHVESKNIQIQSSALRDEELVLEGTDTVLGVYSNGSGSFGSAVVLGEVDSAGELADKWSILRTTSGSALLRITYGSNANYASNATIMQIDPTGEVGIGTTSPGFLLEVNGTAGKPGGGSWTNSSDRRLKKNIQDLDGALDKLLALRGVTFEYKEPEAINELPGERIGMIAQEVEQVIPDWVDVNKRGHKTVTFRGFEAVAVEAIRQLRHEHEKQIHTRDQQIARLEQSVHALHQRLDRLESKMSGMVMGSDGGRR